MSTLQTFVLDNAAYAGFALAWAVHFCTARSYGRVARIINRQETRLAAEDSTHREPVSVVLTAHNQADALSRNLPSILEQEYEDFEVIVVNDASTDDTEDILKRLELKYPHLHHTFIPAGARYVSHKRLSLTVGIKAARNEWLLQTEPDCCPKTSRWIATMSRHFHSDTQIVLGYANYTPKAGYLSQKTIFFNLFHQLQYLPWVVKHKAYRCHPANLAYRKSLFMEHKGFADDVNLIDGAMELLVNRNSTATNTEAVLHPDGKVCCAALTSAKQWKIKRTYYMETRRYFKNTWNYRWGFNLKQHMVPLFYWSAAAATGWSIWRQQWIATGIIALFFILLSILKTVWFNRSARALGEKPYRLSFLWYEMRLHWWHACSLLSRLSAPRSQFRRKAF